MPTSDDQSASPPVLSEAAQFASPEDEATRPETDDFHRLTPAGQELVRKIARQLGILMARHDHEKRWASKAAPRPNPQVKFATTLAAEQKPDRRTRESPPRRSRSAPGRCRLRTYSRGRRSPAAVAVHPPSVCRFGGMVEAGTHHGRSGRAGL